MKNNNILFVIYCFSILTNFVVYNYFFYNNSNIQLYNIVPIGYNFINKLNFVFMCECENKIGSILVYRPLNISYY